MEYNFREVEKKWQEYWRANKTFRADNHSSKPKYYVLDMFPYPSGAGLHVGHPLGYIASDIYARYKRLKGFNVLHPMGYDAFGLPAEQYAIQTGQHPSITTEQNIKRYREQLDNIGFSFDWDRQVRTSDPAYYKWTQWIFLKLFNAWYNTKSKKAETIETLIIEFEKNGNKDVSAATEETEIFSAEQWKAFSEKEQQKILLNYRLACLGEAMVNWCPALGTVLANDEVKDGVSERGGYPVERKLMKQWSLRITAYAQRLLDDLETIDWSDSIKEQQRNWIGRSEGCSLRFRLTPNPSPKERGALFIEVFTTRPDTIFGATFVTLAPEHELIEQITTPDRKKEVDTYVQEAKNRSERERMAEVKRITGVFTGAYVEHPFTKEPVPVWVGDYVLAGYGTGAVMAVPAHDSRDHAFAKHFKIEIKQVITSAEGFDIQKESFDAKEGKCINSDFLNGLDVKDAIKKAIAEIEKNGLGKGKVNFRLRDAVFGRQRYWGEPIPIYYKDGTPYPVEEKDLPVILPEVDKYLPTEDGEPPLARAKNWKYRPHPQPLCKGEGSEYPLETTTMPGWAGSSWYYLRYEDSNDDKAFVSKEAVNYWQNIDLYIGGSEHATGHLLYFRFWTKFLFDLGYIPFEEPAKKLINQGMIQGESKFINQLVIKEKGKPDYVFRLFASNDIVGEWEKGEITIDRLTEMVYDASIGKINLKEEISSGGKISFLKKRVNVDFVINEELDKSAWSKSIYPPDKKDVDFLDRQAELYEFMPNKKNRILVASEVEKMSKSKLNVVNPDEVIEKHGADTLRLYEMFLGPLELPKPWNTTSISGTSNFIRKLWRLYHSQNKEEFFVKDEAPTKAELKTLHKTIKKAQEDIERFSFNTSVSTFMICVNELTDLKCAKRAILEPLAIIVSPCAPHIAEELWSLLGHKESITFASFPEYKEEYLTEDSFAYPVSLNGKMKFNLSLSLALNKEEIEKEVMSAEEVKKLLQGQSPKKIIIVPGKIVNIVV
jgi:leucyl-tRNA synthetase